MQIIYIDSEYKCYTQNDGTMTAIETDFFDGKCAEFIEGYRLIPAGQSLVEKDEEISTGEMISPWKDYGTLDTIQREYEKKLINDLEQQAQAARILLGVE